MVNNDFKLKYYFEIYKDTPLLSKNKFRKKFREKNGKFECIEELMFMIEQYQIEKYGSTLYDYVFFDKHKKGR